MSKLKTLIVEDDISIQLLYDKALDSDKFEKRFCNNGLEALDIYHKWGPEIIILDIYLPVLTGFSVLKQIREDVNDQKTIIIISTSLNQSEHVKDIAKLNIQGYIVKPFNYKEISTKVLHYYHAGISSTISDEFAEG